MKIDTEKQLALPPQEFCLDLMREKYAHNGETDAQQIHARVAKAVGMDAEQSQLFLELQEVFTPGGRINRAAGSELQATMINCFVQPVADTMSGYDDEGRPGIMVGLQQSAETMRRGGGVGYDFSAIRPKGALVKGTQSRASGPVSMMRMYDQMCSTVESAGARRGAQMGILRIDHPDIGEFIDAKRPPEFAQMGLSPKEEASLMSLIQGNAAFGWKARQAFATFGNFNLSIAATDEFMQAVVADTSFDLVHPVEPAGQPDAKTKTLADGKLVYVYRTVRARDLWDRIMRNTYEAAEPGVIFIDRVNRDNSLGYAETIAASNPCGEQMLPPYGCCDLGAMMLPKFVLDAFSAKARFDWNAFKKSIAPAVEFLDRVLDVTVWPLQEQKVEAQSKRRVGLGYLGLGDTLAMLGLRYDSAKGVEMGEAIAAVLRDEAYTASVALAKRLGAFPLFNAEKYLAEGTFASRLPSHIKDAIRKHGIRNSHLLSIAPTGTIAQAFADNASSGIEPIFSLRQKRTKILPDGSRGEFFLENAAYRAFKHAQGKDAESEAFVTAMEMTVDAHLAMLEAVAPYIDSAISKTVNVPAEYPFDDFAGVYMRAWKAGLKGITTYRPNVLVGSVIADASKEPGALASQEPDRRIELKEASNVLDELRWPSRPETPEGIESVTYNVKHHKGNFAVVVGHVTNGSNQPLEVYVAGNEQPAGLAAIAKMLSVDMRTGDAAWLKHKLDSLARTEADDAFVMVDPESRKPVQVPSLVAGFSRLVEHRLDKLGVFANGKQSSMMDYLFVKKEPKTGAQGRMCWHFDVRNHATDDDFVMWVKEVSMPDGSVRPMSVWLSGRYPKVLDGLTKMLSIDMQVSNPEWVLKKLRSLLSFGEQQGHFLAEVPGEKRQQSYPSTVAYMAALLIDRYRVLGLTGGALECLMQSHVEAGSGGHTAAVGNGSYCPSCKTMSLHRRDGCKACENCDFIGECG